MSLFGNRNRFAIEYVLAPDSKGIWMIGSMCFWCDGQALGSLDDQVSLRDGLFCLEQIEKFKNNRETKRFQELSSFEAFNLLSTVLFANSDHLAELVQASEQEQWRKHLVSTFLSDQDVSIAYCLGGAVAERLIYKQDSGNEAEPVKELWLEIGEFDRILESAADRLRREYELNGGPAQ